jgi:Xaa-Pro aminopeptidase
MKPGARGVDVDTAARRSLIADGFKEYPHGTGHPIGLKVHDVGPMLCPDWRERYGDGVFFTLEPDQVFAVEPLIYVKPDALDYELNTSLEEDVVVGPDGARYIGTPQTSLIVIR